MSFLEELNLWIDEDGLIANQMNPRTPQTDGNPLVLAGIAATLISIRKDYETNTISKLKNGCLSLRNPNGTFQKKKNSTDQTTHDDCIGVCTFFNRLNLPGHNGLVKYGMEHKWVMSNTGKTYWDAISKPWNIVFYKISSGYPVNIFSKILLFLYLTVCSLSKGTPSGTILNWMICNVVKGKHKIIDIGVNRYVKKIEKAYGGIKGVFREYFGENHVFTRYS